MCLETCRAIILLPFHHFHNRVASVRVFDCVCLKFICFSEAIIDKKNIIKHCIYRHPKWFTGQAGYRKDLAALGRSLDRTIIIENTPDCIRGYQQNGILVEDYEGGERADNTIPALTDVLRALVDSHMTVQQFVTSCPLLTRGPVQTDIGDYIQVYTLNVGLWKPGQHKRVNRDLPAGSPAVRA